VTTVPTTSEQLESKMTGRGRKRSRSPDDHSPLFSQKYRRCEQTQEDKSISGGVDESACHVESGSEFEPDSSAASETKPASVRQHDNITVVTAGNHQVLSLHIH